MARKNLKWALATATTALLLATGGVLTVSNPSAIASTKNTVQAGSTVQASKPFYMLQFRHSGMCVAAQNFINNSQLVQLPCNSWAGFQLWTLEWTTSQYARFRMHRSNSCINVFNRSQSDGARIILWGCQDVYVNDQWYGEPITGTGYYFFKARHSLRCMVVQNASGREGMPIIQWGCSPGDGDNDQITYIYAGNYDA